MTISATMDGKLKSIEVPSPATNRTWQLTWTGEELSEGVYTTTTVTVNDGKITATANHTGTKTVDKTPPTVPTLVSSKTTLTNQNVAVTITYSADSVTKQYKIGTGAWTNYTVPVTVSANATVYARGTDAVGNISAEGSLVISNIDKVLPVITIPTYVTTPTNKDITVTATTNKGTLNKTSNVFTANGSFEFIATDAAGNVAKRTVTITNIDKVNPILNITAK